MEQPRRGVSAQDVLAAVRVHLDRAHDLVRRLDCPPDSAAEVVTTSALDLVEVVAARPDTVPDAVGWWFARARTLVAQVATVATDVPVGGGLLAVDADQRLLAEALDQLPDRDRVALLLRDSYDLPVASVAAALSTDATGAMELVGRARLAFLPLVDDEPALSFDPTHGSLGTLARLGEGGVIATQDATARRHALSCSSCRDVTDAQQRAHLLLAGLTVVAMDERERAGVLASVAELADSRLPSSRELQAIAVEQDERARELADRRLLSPLLAFAGIVLAALAGLGVGLLLTHDGGPGTLPGADGNLPADIGLVSPSPVSTAVPPSPPTVAESPPQTSVFVITPPSPSPEPAPSLRLTAELSVSPSSGANGTELTVEGTGFTPFRTVTVTYLDPTGAATGATATGTADGDGTFTATLAAQDPQNLPGRHTVQASDGQQRASAGFTAQA